MVAALDVGATPPSQLPPTDHPVAALVKLFQVCARATPVHAAKKTSATESLQAPRRDNIPHSPETARHRAQLSASIRSQLRAAIDIHVQGCQTTLSARCAEV